MKELEAVTQILKDGGVGVMPTDTIYGLVGSALAKDVVERIYAIRLRNTKKPMIILISKLSDLHKFGVKLTPLDKQILNGVWPGKVSVILKTSSRKFGYLRRGQGSLAFRLPRHQKLMKILRRTGPLTAPSANLEGRPPARNIKEAMKYFGDGVDFYFDAGTISGGPSTLISLFAGKVKVLRGQLKRLS